MKSHPPVDSPEWWSALVEAAQAEVALAKGGGNPRAGLNMLRQAEIALTSLLARGEQPDPRDRVYLGGLADALRAIGNGSDPKKALGLDHVSGNVVDPNTGVIAALLFMHVGEELDRLIAEGVHSPTKIAIESVAKLHGRSTHTIRKAWQDYGSAEGWAAHKKGS